MFLIAFLKETQSFYANKMKIKHKCVSFSKRKMDAKFASTNSSWKERWMPTCVNKLAISCLGWFGETIHK